MTTYLTQRAFTFLCGLLFAQFCFAQEDHSIVKKSNSGSETSKTANRDLKIEKSPFRYIIIRDDCEQGKSPNPFHQVDVLMDKKAFSERNLMTLFKLFSKRYERFPLLQVFVYTSLEQFRTLEETEQQASINPPENTELDKYYWSVFSRTSEGESFNFNPNPPNLARKTVVIKRN